MGETGILGLVGLDGSDFSCEPRKNAHEEIAFLNLEAPYGTDTS